MAGRIRSWMTFTAILSLTSMLPFMYAVPLSAEKNTTTKLLGNQSKSDCLYDQYLDIINLVCVNCTYCQPGEEHSSQQNCGYGEGGNTTCVTCDKEYYQSNAGHSQLKCSRCVTCDPNAEVLQECNATQNRECGPCPENHYEYQENICVECTGPNDHTDCAHTTHEPPSTNQSTAPSPTTAYPPSSEALPTAQPSSSLPSGNMTGTTYIPEITGSVTTKDLGLGLGLGVFIVICATCTCISIAVSYYRKRTGTTGTPSSNHSNASYKPVLVATISRDQPSTSSAADAGIECAPGGVLIRSPLVGQEREHLLGAGQPVNPSLNLPSDVTNECLSIPLPLSINGGVIRNGFGMDPHLGQGDYREPASPGSPDSAKVNFSFENDDGGNHNGSCPEPMALRS